MSQNYVKMITSAEQEVGTPSGGYIKLGFWWFYSTIDIEQMLGNMTRNIILTSGWFYQVRDKVAVLGSTRENNSQQNRTSAEKNEQ